MDEFDDELMFADEEELDEIPQRGIEPWRVLIVDDEEEVHRVTKLVLEPLTFAGRPLHFFHAYSGAEALDILKTEHDIALVFLDVVMETDDAGLLVARKIRDEVKNPLVRIVLRTGQPGQAPEDQVIVDYDINDYKLKTELTFTKLFTTVITSLRSYRDLVTIKHHKDGLRKVLDAAPCVFKRQQMQSFLGNVLFQMTNLLRIDEYDRTPLNGMGIMLDHGEYTVVTAIGEYTELLDTDSRQTAPKEVIELFEKAMSERLNQVRDLDFVWYLGDDDDRGESLIYAHANQELSDFDLNLLTIFYNNVLIAHANILLNKEIEDTQSEVIYTLGEVAETRSKETGRHVKRVAEYSKLLALKFGLSEDDAEMLRQASPMHDVGKLGIPDRILNKPGKLNDEEWEVMKTHAGLGRDMLKNSSRELMKAAAIAAGQHHEKWDGSGYPNGLVGDEIHVFGRITAIADVFDALSVRRVYKDAWPLEQVLDFFREQSGKQFDPRLVEILINDIDTFLKILERNTTTWERGEDPVD